MDEQFKKKLSSLSKKFNGDKVYGTSIFVPGLSSDITHIDSIPSGSYNLDSILGVGGIPRGRITEIYGNPSSGKSTLALHICKSAQDKNLIPVYVDLEYCFDPDYAKVIGVDLEKIIVIQPSYGEAMFKAITEMLHEIEDLGVIIIDSVAGIVTRAELDGDIGDSNIGLTARLMGSANRKLVPEIARKNVALVYLNQVRANIGTYYGSSVVTPGGKSLSFFASIRISLSASKENDDYLKVTATTVKNKLYKPYLKAEFYIKYGEGIDQKRELITYLLDIGKIKRTGAWYEVEGLDSKVQGINGLYDENIFSYLLTLVEKEV